MKERIVEASHSPRELEALYRSNPDAFRRDFRDAYAEQQDSQVLAVWHERLFFEEFDGKHPVYQPIARHIWLTIALSFIAGTLAKIPHSFTEPNESPFYERNLGGIVLGSLILYFCILKVPKRKAMGILGFLAAGMIYLNVLPILPKSQTLVLAYLHLPFFFWSLLGLSFLVGTWNDLNGRMNYIRYNGELVIYSTIILLGGIVLTVLTFALFGLLDLHIEDWYLQNVVVYGSIAAPLVSTLLIDRIIGDRFRIAPLLAKIFSPLFLATTLVYLLALIFNQQSPFTDRDFLIAFNGLLLLVLAISVFSISERGSQPYATLGDYLNMGLVSVTLLIDAIALAAILFRLTSYGFTPNRLAVLGANMLAFVHLAGILYYYARFATGKDNVHALDTWIVRYLPAYTVWSLIVAVGFPLLFWFR